MARGTVFNRPPCKFKCNVWSVGENSMTVSLYTDVAKLTVTVINIRGTNEEREREARIPSS